MHFVSYKFHLIWIEFITIYRTIFENFNYTLTDLEIRLETSFYGPFRTYEHWPIIIIPSEVGQQYIIQISTTTTFTIPV